MEKEGKYCKNKSLALCQGHPALCDLVCLCLYVSLFFGGGGLKGPFIHPIPIFSLALFPTPPLPEAEIPHRSHSNVRLSHGAPFLILTQHQCETPIPVPTKYTAMFFWEQKGGRVLTVPLGLWKDMWILGLMWEGMRQDCHQPVSTKSIILLITWNTQGAVQVQETYILLCYFL